MQCRASLPADCQLEGNESQVSAEQRGYTCTAVDCLVHTCTAVVIVTDLLIDTTLQTQCTATHGQQIAAAASDHHEDSIHRITCIVLLTIDNVAIIFTCAHASHILLRSYCCYISRLWASSQ